MVITQLAKENAPFVYSTSLSDVIQCLLLIMD